MRVLEWKVEESMGNYYAYVKVEYRSILRLFKKVTEWRLLENDLGVGCIDKHGTLNSAKTTIKEFIEHHETGKSLAKVVAKGSKHDLFKGLYDD